MGIDPSRMDDMDYVRRKSDAYDRLAYGRDAFESAYRTPSVERRMDPYTGEMVDMPIRTPSTGETWSMGELMEPTTEEDYLASEAAKELYMGYDSKESLDRARKTGEAPPEGLELPEGYRKSLRRELASDTRIYGPPEHLRETGPAYAGYKDTSSMVGISPEALDDYYTDIYGKEYTADPWRSTGFGKWSELL